MFQYESEINEISTAATRESVLEKMFFKIIDLWNTTPLHLVPHHTQTGAILIISSLDDLLAQLEESQMTLATVKGSSYIEPIKVNIPAEGKCARCLQLGVTLRFRGLVSF